MAYGNDDYPAHYWQTHQQEIQTLTRNTITELPKMHEELADIRQRGMAMDREGKRAGGSPAWRRRCSIFNSACLMRCRFLCRPPSCSKSASKA